MAKSIIGVGTTANDGTGDTLRAAGVKINDNFSEIYNALGTGSAITLAPTVTELNYVDGVTSAIQTQLDTKASLTGTETLTNKTLTAPKINVINDANGNEMLGTSVTASATDYLIVKNGIGVGSPPHFYADGDSTNIGIHIQPKGTGLLTISDGADFNKGIRFRSVSSATGVTTLIDAVSTAGRVITLPDATDTLVARTTTDTLTNKTLTSPVLGGTTISASGNIVVKPATNILEIQGDGSTVGQIQLNCPVNTHGQKIASQPHSESATNKLTLPGGTTIGNADAVLVSDTGIQTLSNKTAGVATATSTAASLGYLGVPQNSRSANYTTVIGDAGKHIYVTSTATITIDSNANVAYPIGTTIEFIAATGATVTIAITADTMYLAGTGTTGSRTLAAFGMATAVKVTATTWFISGFGLT